MPRTRHTLLTVVVLVEFAIGLTTVASCGNHETSPPSARATPCPSVPPPSAPPFVELQLVVTPPSARVEIGGVAIRESLLRLEKGRVVELTVNAPGYVAEKRKVQADFAGDVVIELRKQGAVPTPKTITNDL